MATNRFEILQQMVQQDAANTFARYGLAMEYARAAITRQRLRSFASCCSRTRTMALLIFMRARLRKNGEKDRSAGHV